MKHLTPEAYELLKSSWRVSSGGEMRRRGGSAAFMSELHDGKHQTADPIRVVRPEANRSSIHAKVHDHDTVRIHEINIHQGATADADAGAPKFRATLGRTVFAPDPAQHDTIAMRHLTGLADKHKVKLLMDRHKAQPHYPGPAVSADNKGYTRLTPGQQQGKDTFHRLSGFRPHEGDDIIRHPQEIQPPKRIIRQDAADHLRRTQPDGQ